MDGLTQSETAISKNKVVTLVDFPSESYTSSVSVTKNLDYLGTVRGRLGFLLTPTFLVYGAGGFAYGGASFNTSFIANESQATPYPTVSAQSNSGQTRTGWTAGGGLEWTLKSNLSAKIEYLYYDLGTINNNVVLTQINRAPTPSVPWGEATVNSSTRFAEGAVRVGLNYHFG